LPSTLLKFKLPGSTKIEVRYVQFKNELLILVTLLGIVMEIIEVASNAVIPILVTLLGIVMELSAPQFRNA
jgi:hypothetical protein